MGCGKNMIHRVPSIYKKNILESPANEICIWVPANEIMHTHTRNGTVSRSHRHNRRKHTRALQHSYNLPHSRNIPIILVFSLFNLFFFFVFKWNPKRNHEMSNDDEKKVLKTAKMAEKIIKKIKMSSSSAENVNRLHLYCKFSYRSHTIDYCFVFPWFLIQFYALDVSLANFLRVSHVQTMNVCDFFQKNNGQYDANALCFVLPCFYGVAFGCTTTKKEKLTRKLNISFRIKDGVRPDRTEKRNIHTAALRLTNTKYEYEQMPALAVCNEMFSQFNMATPIQLMCEVWWGIFCANVAAQLRHLLFIVFVWLWHTSSPIECRWFGCLNCANEWNDRKLKRKKLRTNWWGMADRESLTIFNCCSLKLFFRLNSHIDSIIYRKQCTKI